MTSHDSQSPHHPRDLDTWSRVVPSRDRLAEHRVSTAAPSTRPMCSEVRRERGERGGGGGGGGRREREREKGGTRGTERVEDDDMKAALVYVSHVTG